MRKNLRLFSFFLLSMLFTQLHAENIKQSFSPTFGPTYANPNEGTVDGWLYYGFNNNNASGYPERVLYGDASATLYAYSSYEKDAYLISPEKTGGVGWVSFWYKLQSDLSAYVPLPVQMRISISENGTDFTEIETVDINPTDTKNFSYYSNVINNTGAVKVKIEAIRPVGSYVSFELNIDELIITDATTTGTPAHILGLAGNIALESEINTTASSQCLLKGVGFSGTVNFAIDGENSPFALPSASVAGSSITESGYNLPVSFAPVRKGFSTGILKITADGLPEMVFPLKGAALERTIVEGFNEKGGLWDNNSMATFDYHSGWTVLSGGTYYAGPGGNASYAMYILEGDRSLILRGTLTSPRKTGGIGIISFMHRNYSVAQQIPFVTEISEDGITWTEIDNATATGGDFTPYMKTVNNATARYVRIRITQGSNQQDGILIDQFIITENNQVIPSATGPATIAASEGSSVKFNVPLTFSDIQSAVSLAIDNPQFSLGKTTLTAAEATGTTALEITYTPETNGFYTSANLTLSGGDMYYPVNVKVSGYLLQPTLFTNFDAAWGSTIAGSYMTDAGWNVFNGSRAIPSNALFGSAGAVCLYEGGNLTSPPKSQGVGSIHFFARSSSSYGSTTFGLSISEDGTTWTRVASDLTVTADYTEIEQVVDNATAKYVRIDMASSSNSMFVDNFTVTRNNKKIPHVVQVNQPLFMTSAGVEQKEVILLQGTNIDSDIELKFKSGTAFSLHGQNTIPASEINDKEKPVEVYFLSETGTYFTDTLVVSGEDFSFERTFPVKGYNTSDLIFQDFEGTWQNGSAYNIWNIGGWELTGGSKNDYDVISGKMTLALSAGGTFLSVPKSGGVGAISFLYKNSANIPVRISLYKSLSEEALAVLDTVLTTVSAPTSFDYIFNQEDAVYVKIQNQYVDWGPLQIDDLCISANGKKTPKATSPAGLMALYAYPDETMNQSFDLLVEGVADAVTLSLKNGSSFSIDKTGFTPESETVTEAITITYTGSGEFFTTDTLVVDSKGLLKPLLITLRGNILEETIVQDFNREGWIANTDGSFIIDGWVVINGTREVTPANVYEGQAALHLTASPWGTFGNLTSPAKAGGVNKVSFYYRCEAMDIYLQTSVDGINWVNKDSLISTATDAKYQYFISEIGDPDAKFFRLQTKSVSYKELYIDSVVVNAMPYLRQVSPVAATLETTTVPFIIPLEIKGLLNTNAQIVQDDNAHYTLSVTEIKPEELANNAGITLTVTFTADAKGVYPNEIRITNEEIQTIVIPLTVVYNPTGITKIAGDVRVYLSGGILNVCGAPAGTDISVINVQGQTILRSTVNSYNEQLNLPLPSGIYLVKVGETIWKIRK